ncbi:MAG: MotA/TolQ/ExbB proton channel family protein [Gammaproteobacteria bacterium]|nr:MotA/TolQ/ExbB proton channel family protein [Gammaproteobacteria bacterium]MBT8075908.1 MotA/TolQ/ExbB proton channel family protein [Gammaproteobacteria bacterium]NNK98823.1 energy transducer TonB [Xanthomonadales bacterium]
MISMIKKIGLASGLILAVTMSAQAATAISLDELLQQVKTGRVNDAAENQARLDEFRARRAEQGKLLAAEKAEQRRQEELSAQMEKQFEVNDVKIIDMERAFQERLGGLKELFGVLQQASGDARGNFEASVTQVQFPDRTAFLLDFAKKMGQSNRLASMEEIERLWFELQREMTETGKVSTFTTNVVNSSGEENQQEVTRVGAFNVVSDGKYLEFVPETGRLVELQRQPPTRYTNRLGDLVNANSGMFPVGLDPTRGQLLGLLVQSPSLTERIAQGKTVGYVIISLGIVGVLIAIWRVLALYAVGAKVRKQIKNINSPSTNNPLGRVLKVAQDSTTTDIETMELKLGEAILRETPKFNSMLPLLKIISVVAPLLGLLGTVTGMIVTFQAITLYGAGDPKLMAGGISTALVTTVLGLCVAIPTVFLHTLVSSRARRLTQILQEEAAGMLAERAESEATS